MADPLSVAGSAVGIVSLGLDVSRGLTWYLGSIKGREQEIKSGQKEFETLSSIHCSLDIILSSVNIDIIQECLKDSKLELQELHQLLEELKGTSTSSTSLKGKIKDTGRSIIYPFREGKLISLRQTLQRLLDNLNLAIDTASLRCVVEQDRKIDAIQTILENLRDEVHIRNNGFSDISTQIQAIQLTPTNTLSGVERQLACIQTSIMSRQELHDIFSQLLDEKILFAKRGPRESECGSAGLVSSRRSSSSRPQEAFRLRVGTKATTSHPRVVSPICDCPLASHSVTYTNTFCGIKVRCDQQIPGKHLPGCTFYGIDRKIERTTEVQFLFKMKWLFASTTQTSIALTTGNNNPGISIRLKNFVPQEYSPFCRSVTALFWSLGSLKTPQEYIRTLHDFRRTVFLMYEEGKTSPNDRDEFGRNHVQILLDQFAIVVGDTILANDSVAAVFIQLLCDLTKLIQVDGEKIQLFEVVYYVMFRNPSNLQRMISTLATIVEIDSDFVKPYQFRKHSCRDIVSTLTHFPDLIDVIAMDSHPIAGAILSQSLTDLKHIVLRDPEAPMVRVFGLTTPYLCAFWPEGLQVLLETEAKSLIDIGLGFRYSFYMLHSPVLRAAYFNVAKSVDILMKAGCQWHADMWSGSDIRFPRKMIARGMRSLSCEVVSVIAFNLAERRRNLLRWAEQKLRIPRRADPSYVPDSIAADLCQDLDRAGVSFHPWLRVSQSYKSIYHFPGYPLRFFPVFFEEGFQDCAAYDDKGLTPVMVWRKPNWHDRNTLPAILWLREQGLLDQKAEDPLRLGLNVHATGWHYIASMFGVHYYEELGDDDHRPLIGWEFMNRLSQVGIRDECVCWCSLDGKGCSPLMSMWKAHADTCGMGMTLRYCNNGVGGVFPLRHLLFHDANMFGMKENEPSTPLLEFLRFITFEALDMEHTCCALGTVDLSNRSCHIIRGSFCAHIHLVELVLAHRDPKIVKRTRSKESEQENARTLESLMKDFTEKLKTMEPSPKALETFLWGYWRRRISQLYAVNTEFINGIGRELINVQTHVLPKIVLKFLGKDFDLLRFNTQEASMSDDDDDDASSIEDIELSPHCPICDGENSDSDDIDEGDESDDAEDSDDE